MKLKHPLRYYLTKQWVDVGGVKVLYTPANETTIKITTVTGDLVADLHIEGGYSLITKSGYTSDVVCQHYAGESESGSGDDDT